MVEQQGDRLGRELVLDHFDQATVDAGL